MKFDIKRKFSINFLLPLQRQMQGDLKEFKTPKNIKNKKVLLYIIKD